MSKPALTLYDHVRELRRRLFVSALALLAGGFLGYGYHKPIISFLSKPIHESLYYTSPAGGFNFVMKVCFMVGVGLAVPILVYNVLRFISPALGDKLSRKRAYMVTLLSFVLAIAGAAFAYFIVVPMSLRFFQGFQTSTIKPLLSATEYLTFVLNCVLSFMLIFQLPLFIIFIDRIKPIPPRKFLKLEKWVIIGSLGIALILPFTYDPLTQFLIAVPIIVLYNFSVALIFLAHRSRRRAENRTEKRAAKAQQKYNDKHKDDDNDLRAVDRAIENAVPALMEVVPVAAVVQPVVLRAKVRLSAKPTQSPPTTLHQPMRSNSLQRQFISDFKVAKKAQPAKPASVPSPKVVPSQRPLRSPRVISDFSGPMLSSDNGYA